METQTLNSNSSYEILQTILDKLTSIETEIKELKKEKEDPEIYKILDEMKKHNLIGEEKDLEKYGIKF
jgi:hypothetical protein